jgi:hypothetical protein
MSDRFALIQPYLSATVKKLIHRRLTRHEGLIRDGAKLSEKRRAEIKIALLAVHIINPLEEFFDPEEALIRGISTDTLKKRQDEARRDPRLKLKEL